jgi:hypothetical protein
MKTFRFLAVALALTALALFNTPSERWSLTPFAPAELHAQATTTQTTLSAAVTVSDRVIVVASATGFAAGRTAVVDGEAFVVASNYVSGTTIPVQRGANSTGVTAHASGAVVLAGPPNYFAKNDPIGPCTATDQIALPLVVVPGNGQPSGVSVYNCQGASATTQRWQLYSRNGYPMAVGWTANTPAGVAPPTYTSAGAITLMPGLQFIGSGGALAMTLANPALYQSGTVMTLMASTAQAHTITYTAGYFGTTTSSDVCTLGARSGITSRWSRRTRRGARSPRATATIA